MQTVIADVIGDDVRSSSIFDMALGYARSLVTGFRTEERRKVHVHMYV